MGSTFSESTSENVFWHFPTRNLIPVGFVLRVGVAESSLPAVCDPQGGHDVHSLSHRVAQVTTEVVPGLLLC